MPRALGVGSSNKAMLGEAISIDQKSQDLATIVGEGNCGFAFGLGYMLS
jgi:hypothetical protein